MIDEFITKVGNTIRDTLGSWFSLSWIPEHWFWWWWLIVFGVVCGLIIFFFGWSKIVRIVASMAFLLAAVFVAGGHVMSRRMNAKKAFEEAREKQRQAARARENQPQQPRENWWPFG